MKYCFYVSTAVCCSDFSCYAISFPHPHIFNSSGSSQCLPRCNSANVLEQMGQTVLISKDFEEKSAQIDTPNCHLVLSYRCSSRNVSFKADSFKAEKHKAKLDFYLNTNLRLQGMAKI